MELVEFSDVLGMAIVIYVIMLALNNNNLKMDIKKGVIFEGITLSIVYVLDLIWYFILYTSDVSEQSDFILNLIACIDYLMIPVILISLLIICGPEKGSFKYYFCWIGIVVSAIADIANIYYPIFFYHKDLQMYYAPTGLALYILCTVVFFILLEEMILRKSFDYEDVFLVTFVGIIMIIGVIAAWCNYDLRTLWECLGISYILMYLAFSEMYNKTDVITGIPNRNAYEKAMAHIKNNYSSILMIDMNALKYYNDNMGHTKGDQYICATAKTLADAFEGHGKLYRVGGDEFCLVSNDSKDVLDSIVNEILKKGRCDEKYGDFQIDFAYGIAERQEGDTPELVYENADKLMYENKFMSKRR